MKNKKQDEKLTKAELEKAIRQLEKIRNNQTVWSSFNKHMQGGIMYRLGKFRRLLREK
jgi:threonine aldolase